MSKKKPRETTENVEYAEQGEGPFCPYHPDTKLEPVPHLSTGFFIHLGCPVPTCKFKGHQVPRPNIASRVAAAREEDELFPR